MRKIILTLVGAFAGLVVAVFVYILLSIFIGSLFVEYVCCGDHLGGPWVWTLFGLYGVICIPIWIAIVKVFRSF
jgi:hypothetical protein